MMGGEKRRPRPPPGRPPGGSERVRRPARRGSIGRVQKGPAPRPKSGPGPGERSKSRSKRRKVGRKVGRKVKMSVEKPKIRSKSWSKSQNAGRSIRAERHLHRKAPAPQQSRRGEGGCPPERFGTPRGIAGASRAIARHRGPLPPTGRPRFFHFGDLPRLGRASSTRAGFFPAGRRLFLPRAASSPPRAGLSLP